MLWICFDKVEVAVGAFSILYWDGYFTSITGCPSAEIVPRFPGFLTSEGNLPLGVPLRHI